MGKKKRLTKQEKRLARQQARLLREPSSVEPFVQAPLARVTYTARMLEEQVTLRKALRDDPFLGVASRMLPKYNYASVWYQAIFDFWDASTMTAVCFNYESTNRVHTEIIDRWYYIRSGILVFRCDYGDLSRLSYICSCLPHVKGIAARRDLIDYESASLARTRIKADFALPLWEEARLFLDPSRIGTQQPDHTIKLILS